MYGYFVLYAATLMTETFFIAAVLWSLEAALRVADTIREQKRVPGLLALQLGLSLSVSTLLRQSILPWVPVLFVYLFWLGWRRGRLASALRVAVAVGGGLEYDSGIGVQAAWLCGLRESWRCGSFVAGWERGRLKPFVQLAVGLGLSFRQSGMGRRPRRSAHRWATEEEVRLTD